MSGDSFTYSKAGQSFALRQPYFPYLAPFKFLWCYNLFSALVLFTTAYKHRLWKIFTLEHIKVYQHFHWTLPCTANCICSLSHATVGLVIECFRGSCLRHFHLNLNTESWSDTPQRGIYKSELSCLSASLSAATPLITCCSFPFLLDFHGKFCFTEIALDFPEKLNNRTIKENTNLVSFGFETLHYGIRSS